MASYLPPANTSWQHASDSWQQPPTTSTPDLWQNYSGVAKNAPSHDRAERAERWGGEQRKVCYICKKSNHFARECPHDDGRRKRMFDMSGRRLDTINWNGEDIVPVKKDFGTVHPAVNSLTDDDCEMIQLRLGIEVNPKEAPKPIECLEHLPFPDWAATVLRQNKGWKQPLPIQVQGWPAAVHGHDVLGIASTGSGKTMTYVLPMLVHILGQPELKPGEGCVGLVLMPFRELCNQVLRDINLFEPYTGLKCQTVTGGEDTELQCQKIMDRVDVVVATPGRMVFMLNNKHTNLRRTTFVVLDEADQLLTDDFRPQTEMIMDNIRPDRQVLLFSATWNDMVQEHALKICNQKPIQICVGCKGIAACKDIEQQFVCPGRCPGWIKNEPKTEVLCRSVKFLLQKTDGKALVFCNRHDSVEVAVAALKAENINCLAFTGQVAQQHRQSMLDRFAQETSDENDLRVLVCTQVLGRGHDFRSVKYVINYDMPNRIVDYVHRIGRTGRAGEQGFSLTLLEEVDLRWAKELLKVLEQSDQQVPDWLKTESHKVMKYKRMYREVHEQRNIAVNGVPGDPPSSCPVDAPTAMRTYPADMTGPAQTARSPSPADFPTENSNWSGRGRGRVAEFLAQCKGRGVARKTS